MTDIAPLIAPEIAYGAVALTGVAALSAVLVVIGRLAATCPETAAAARLATWVVTTAFAAIGTGAAALIGAAMPLLASGSANGFMIAVGVMAIALGVGFANAAITLRDILSTAQRPQAG